MGGSHLLGVVLLTNLRILLFLHQICESKDLANRIRKRCQGNNEAKVLSWGHLCLSSQLSLPLDSHWVFPPCSPEEGTEVTVTDEGGGLGMWSKISLRLGVKCAHVVREPTEAVGSALLIHSPGLPTPLHWQKALLPFSTQMSLAAFLRCSGYFCLITPFTLSFSSEQPPPHPVTHLHPPPKAASLLLWLTSCSWGMRPLRPCLFETVSPSCAWEICWGERYGCCSQGTLCCVTERKE